MPALRKCAVGDIATPPPHDCDVVVAGRGRRAAWRRCLRTEKGQENIFMFNCFFSRAKRRHAVPLGRRVGAPMSKALNDAAASSSSRLEAVPPPPRKGLLAAGRRGQKVPLHCHVAAWNQQRSFVLHPECLTHFLAAVRRSAWQMCAVSAAWRWRKSGRYGHGDFECLWSQSLTEGEGQHYGVGLFVHSSVLPSLVSFVPVSSRVLLARFAMARGRYMTVVVVYAPVSGKKNPRISFFKEVKSVIQTVDPADLLIVIGDHNSQVGRAQDASQSSVLGPEWDSIGLGTGGEELFAFCEGLGLCVAATFFRNKASARRSHELIGGQGLVTNDHVLVRREQLSSVQGVRVRQGDERQNLGFCHSDHHPLVATVRLKLRAAHGRARELKEGRPARPDLRMLAVDGVRERYAAAVAERVEAAGGAAELSYEQLAGALTEAAAAEIPARPAAGKPSASAVACELAAERQALYREAAAAGRLREPGVRKRLGELRRRLRNRHTRDARRAMTTVARLLQRLDRAGCAAQFYGDLRRIAEPQKPAADLVDEEGRLCTEEVVQCAVLARHFSRVLGEAGGQVCPSVRADFAARAAAAVRAPEMATPDEAAVLAAVEVQAQGKAADELGVCADLMRAAAVPGGAVAAALTRIVGDVWRSGEMPAERCRSLLIALYKNKGDPQQVTNYRGVVLVQFLWRVVMRLLLGPGVIPGIETILPETQCGGRPQRGCTDQIFSLRLLQEQAYARRVPLYAAFIDLAKAFDSLDRALLFDMMASCGFPVGVVDLFQSMYSQTTCAVRRGRTLGDSFGTHVGIQQGCISGSWCFNLFLHFVFEPILDELAELGVVLRVRASDGRHLDARELRAGKEGGIFRLGVLFIVDDTTLVSDSVEGLRRGLALVYERLSAFGLVVNASKSDAICFAGALARPCIECGGREGPDGSMLLCSVCSRACHVRCAGLETVPEGDWWCDGCGGGDGQSGAVLGCAQEAVDAPLLPFGDGAIAWTDEVKYLGVRLTADCGLAVELTQRVRLARAAFRRLRPLLGGGRMGRGMKGTFARAFSALTQSVLLHGCEAWALAPGELKRLEVVQRQLLRQALPRARRSRLSTSTVALYSIFRVPTVETLWTRAQLRWLGHLARANEGRVARRLLGAVRVESGHPGRGNRGASLMGIFGQEGSLLGHLRRHLTASARRQFFGGRRGEWFLLAQNKDAWRKFVKGVNCEHR